MPNLALHRTPLDRGAGEFGVEWQLIEFLPTLSAKLRMSGRGRLDSVTNGRFQVSQFNDSFPAMNLKSGRSPGDPMPTFTL